MDKENKVLVVDMRGISVQIHSNDKPNCAHCGIKITPENDSGWEVFVNSFQTQPICKNCEIKSSKTEYFKVEE